LSVPAALFLTELSLVSSGEQKRANEESVRFQEFDALAQCGNDLSEDADVVVRALVGNSGQGASGVGRAADGTNHMIPRRSEPKGPETPSF
jgi:hypothetical protein